MDKTRYPRITLDYRVGPLAQGLPGSILAGWGVLERHDRLGIRVVRSGGWNPNTLKSSHVELNMVHRGDGRCRDAQFRQASCSVWVYFNLADERTPPQTHQSRCFVG